MNCEEKSRLATEYETSTTKFSEAVTKLRKKMGMNGPLARCAGNAGHSLSYGTGAVAL